MESKLIIGPIHELGAQRVYFNFLTHVKYATQAGLRWPANTVTEFGVGASFGIAFCALLAGAKRFFGFDAIVHMNPAEQFDLLAELRELFIQRAPAKNNTGLVAFEFPGSVISDDIIEHATSLKRFNEIKKELGRLADTGHSNIFNYIAPYDTNSPVRDIQSSDLLLSTATLEHIDDMEGAYKLFYKMLTSSGFMSHSIDFKSHGFAKQHNGKKHWNGHWLMTEAEWRAIAQKHTYSINRIPCSDHLKLIIKAHFKPLLINKRMQENELSWRDLAIRWQWMTAEDLCCSGLHVVATKSAR
jgi:hypothetical protein